MTTERPPWFKCFPEKLLGAFVCMSHDAICLYTIILLRIYEVGGPIGDSPKALSQRCKMSEKRVGVAFGELCDMRKVTIDENGKVDSDTTHEFLDERDAQILSVRKRGILGAEKRWGHDANGLYGKRYGKTKQYQTQTDSSAMLEACLSNAEKSRIEKKNKKKKTPMPNGTALDILKTCLTEETAKAVLEHRKAKRTPTTSKAAELLAKAFADTGLPNEAANEMIVRGWASFRPGWDWKPKAMNGSVHPITTASGIFVKRDTPQWEAWQVWWMKTKGKSMPGGDGWYCPSEWPP